MKYLVMGQLAVPVPPEKAADLFKAAKDWMNKGLKDGTHDCHYIVPHGTQGFTITNANSHEELMDLINDYPLYPFLQFEVNALCDSDHAYENAIKLWQKLATQ